MAKIVDWNMDDVIDVHQRRKSKRIRRIAKELKGKKRVNYNRFLVEMQYNGVRKNVAEGYIEVLMELGVIRHDKDDIVWNGENQGKSDNQR